MLEATTIPSLDLRDLEAKIKAMYRDVADNPGGSFHFEMGRALAERLGYDPRDLDRVPPEAVESFAGVGHYFNLAALRSGETVVDLGSGAGMDTFIAALHVGAGGRVIGIDMTEEQLAKAERLRDRDGFGTVTYMKGYIDAIPLPDGVADAVISNGVINLVTDKRTAFREVARILKAGGRLALSDIVTDLPLPETVVCNATLWAACIGGASQRHTYSEAIEAAGLRIAAIVDNPTYGFVSERARNAQRKWGARSVSVLAIKI